MYIIIPFSSTVLIYTHTGKAYWLGGVVLNYPKIKRLLILLSTAWN